MKAPASFGPKRPGRERRFELEPRPLEEVRGYLDLVSQQWDEALGRLKKLVET